MTGLTMHDLMVFRDFVQSIASQFRTWFPSDNELASLPDNLLESAAGTLEHMLTQLRGEQRRRYVTRGLYGKDPTKEHGTEEKTPIR